MSRLAHDLKIPQSRIDALLKDKCKRPAHILANGRVRYIVADVAHRLAPSGIGETSNEKGEAPLPPPNTPEQDATPSHLSSSTAGLFYDAARRAMSENG